MASIASTRLTELSLKSNFLSQNIKVSGESKFEVKPTGLAIVCQQNDISKISRRTVASSILLLPFLTSSKAFALLEEDDDEELLLRVKRDRKSKIEKRESLGSYKSEAGRKISQLYISHAPPLWRFLNFFCIVHSCCAESSLQTELCWPSVGGRRPFKSILNPRGRS